MGNFCDSCTSRKKETRYRHAVTEGEAVWFPKGMVTAVGNGSAVPIHCVIGDSSANALPVSPPPLSRKRYVVCRREPKKDTLTPRLKISARDIL